MYDDRSDFTQSHYTGFYPQPDRCNQVHNAGVSAWLMVTVQCSWEATGYEPFDADLRSGFVEGSYLRLIDGCITQL